MIFRKVATSVASAIAITFAPSTFSSAMPQDLPLERLLEQVGSNPELRVEQERTKSRQARLGIVELRNLPTLQFSGDGDLVSSNDEQRLVTATLEKRIIDWGAHSSELESATERLTAQRHAIVATETELRRRVVDSYLAAFVSEQQLVATKMAIATTSDIRSVMQRRLDQRVDAANDLLLIDSRINQLQSRVFQLNGAKRDAQLNLLQTVGYRANVQETLSCKGSLDEAFLAELALEQSADLAATKARSRSIKAEFGAVDAKRLPAIVAGVSLSRDIHGAEDEARAFLRIRYNYDLGDSLDAELAELNADYSASVFEERRLAQSIVRETAGLVNQYQINASQLPLLESLAELRQQQLGSFRRRFSSGKSSLLDLLNIESELLDARLARIDAFGSACQAILTLEQLVGRNLRD
jgi:adhesin transport system outer membrane protein